MRGVTRITPYHLASPRITSHHLEFVSFSRNTLIVFVFQSKCSVRLEFCCVPKYEGIEKVLHFENDARIQTPYPKLMIMVSFCWKMNFPHNKIEINSILLMMSLKLTIKVVVFFLGHPCIESPKLKEVLIATTLSEKTSPPPPPPRTQKKKKKKKHRWPEEEKLNGIFPTVFGWNN